MTSLAKGYNANESLSGSILTVDREIYTAVVIFYLAIMLLSLKFYTCTVSCVPASTDNFN